MFKKTNLAVLTAESLGQANALAGQLIPFRSPAPSVDEAGMLEELRLAIGGVLHLDQPTQFRKSVRGQLEETIRRGGPLPRAIIVNVSTQGLEGSVLARHRDGLDEIVAALSKAAAGVDRTAGVGR